VQDNHNPIFDERFVLKCMPHHELKFDIYDVDAGQAKNKDLMGSVLATVEELLAAAKVNTLIIILESHFTNTLIKCCDLVCLPFLPTSNDATQM
jgi:hypothetical protein